MKVERLIAFPLYFFKVVQYGFVVAEKEKTIAEKEKAKAEKRVPVGN